MTLEYRPSNRSLLRAVFDARLSAEDRVRIAIANDESIANELISPLPTGGGWYLDSTTPGSFEREFTSAGLGRFRGPRPAPRRLRFLLLILDHLSSSPGADRLQRPASQPHPNRPPRRVR